MFGAAFGGQLTDSPGTYFRSLVPDTTSLKGLAFADPSSVAQGGYQDFSVAISTSVTAAGLAIEIGDLAMATQAVAVRDVVGSFAQSFGVSGSQFNGVAALCAQNISAVVSDAGKFAVSGALGAFGLGANLLGYSNPYGWIVMIAVKIGKKIAQVVTAQKDAAGEYKRSKVSAQYAVPLASVTDSSTESDEILARRVFRFLSPTDEYDPMAIASPAYLPGQGGLGWVAVPVKEHPEVNDELPTGWIAHPSAVSKNIGFVPGTGNLRRPIFLPMSYSSSPQSGYYGCTGGPVRDMGSLYPTATGLSAFWWRHLFQSTIGPFTLDCEVLRDLWVEAMQSDFEFARNLTTGWSCVASTPERAFGSMFDCFGKTPGEFSVADRGLYGIGDCRRSNRGEVLKIPPRFALGHFGSVLQKLFQLYFGYDGLADWAKYVPMVGTISQTSGTYHSGWDGSGGKYPNPDRLDYTKSVVFKALDALEERQNLLLLSRHAFYVNGEDTPEGRGTFPAFRTASKRDQWTSAITQLFASGDWKGVTFADVPRGQVRELLRQRAITAGYANPETDLNPPCAPGAAASCYAKQFAFKAPSVLGDPALPVPPKPNDVDPGGAQGLTTRAPRSSSSGAGLIGAVGVAALAAALYARRR